MWLKICLSWENGKCVHNFKFKSKDKTRNLIQGQVLNQTVVHTTLTLTHTTYYINFGLDA